MVESRKLKRTYKLYCYAIFHSNFTKWSNWNEVSMDWSVSLFFMRTMTNITLNITYLQDNYLVTYGSMTEFMTDTQMVAVLTYLCT